MSNRVLLFLTTASLAAAIGCGGPPHTPGEKYYLVVPNLKSPYWDQVKAGLDKAAKDLNVHASMIGDETFDPKLQAENFKRIAAMKPAGIMVSPADPALIGPAIDAAIAAGTPVITVDSDAPESKRLFFVGTNNFEAGQLGGRTAAKELNGKGNVVAILTASQQNMQNRLQGYRSVFEGYPQIKIVEVVDMKGDPKLAFDKAMDLVDKADAFISMDGQSAKEVAEVLKRKNAKGKVVIAMDTLAPTLEAIESGFITATIAQKPFSMGYVGLRMLCDLELNKLPSLNIDFTHNPNSPLPEYVDTGLSLVTKANLAEYRSSSGVK
ncbi:MAG: D-allose-binding periplasmic protein [Bryobacteraceae bacterium]|nr:D-allose-binding periplasmic protein [Bryobacteraceae bacterium]